MDGTAAADLYNGVLVGSSIAAPGVIVNQTVPCESAAFLIPRDELGRG